MARLISLVILIACAFVSDEGARILAVFPTPSISHQVVFRTLTLELVNRGHEVVVLTTDPIFKDGGSPKNLNEIDAHDVSYDSWSVFTSSNLTTGNKKDMRAQSRLILTLLMSLFEKQMQLEEMKKLVMDKSQKFDLLILEAYFWPLLGLTHIFKAPVIQVSSFGSTDDNLKTFGAVIHPFLYPTCGIQRVNNLTFWEKVSNIYNTYITERNLAKLYEITNEMLKRVFGESVPSIDDLRNNVDLLLLNIHPIWERNRPVPPNVIFMGGVHQKPEKELPQDLKNYLDASENGVIYISFGTNVEPASLPPEKIQSMIAAVSKSPYDVLWKWNHDELPGRTSNIKISKWFPQSDLLRHPKVKLFITQGGLQSTDEAITAGVPLIGIPMFGDQWFNIEQYEYHNIGIKIDMDTISEEKLRNAIETIRKDKSYYDSIARLRTFMYDQPQSPLERAMWWTEHVIRHSGARHLRTAAANMPWHQYLEIELVIYVILGLSTVILSIVFACYLLYRTVIRLNKSAKLKRT